MQATHTNPSPAVSALANCQSLSAVPSATATTDSPSAMIVNSAKRSGTWLESTGTARWIATDSGGSEYSSADAMPQTTYRAGSSPTATPARS